MDPRLLELIAPLAALVPPAGVFDKPVYSAFAGHKLHRHLQDRGTDTLVVTGSETDVCVLATVIGAVDHGYRVIVVVTDAVCSSSDEGHDAMLKLYRERYSLQIEAVGSEAILSAWSARWAGKTHFSSLPVPGGRRLAAESPRRTTLSEICMAADLGLGYAAASRSGSWKMEGVLQCVNFSRGRLSSLR